MAGEPPQAPRSLADTFRRLIEADGPISLQQFMGESNARYYAHKDPLGRDGDFVTAPEISQMFGELIGLWLADMWLRAGSPADAIYVELGSGRGTLASDALRAMKRCGLEPQVHLVEGSPALRSLQRAAVPAAHFHDDLGTVPDDGPLLVVANEFLDALPVRQLVRAPEGWREVVVALDADGRFVPVAGTRPMDAAVPEVRREAGEGTLIETCPGAAAVTGELAARLAQRGGAALVIDYGYTAPQSGSTLQAVQAHRKVDVFATPGEADLTAHVDFAAMAEVAQARGATWLGTVEQGPWLRAMGIEQRAAVLAAAAPDQREALALAVERLTHAEQMGELFKVMGLAAPGWKGGAGFG
jgi:NADH dehydrogenase [ubiquinone] 1 alpha subcomplex assembly factor 7